jgi:hypothetical protein
MIAAMVVLAGAVAVLAVVVGLLALSHQRERDGWATERRQLVDRAIARHSGEIVALDRHANRHVDDDGERAGPVLVEGLN